MTDETPAPEPRAEGLLACPFCGGAAILTRFTSGDQQYRVLCPNQACSVDPFADGDTEAEAIAAWNRRPTPAPSALSSRLREMVAALEPFVTMARKLENIYVIEQRFIADEYDADGAGGYPPDFTGADCLNLVNIAAELAALDGREAGWLPIESAPRDGCYLVTNALGEVCPCQSREGVRIISNMPGYADWTWPQAMTAWQPLPAPPARTQPAGEVGT